MKKQPLIHGLFIYLFLIIFCGCHQKKTNDGLNIPTKTESEETSQKTTAVEKPAVIYKSNDLGKTWSSFANGIPADATLSSIQQDENKIYVATDYHGIFVASDGQDNWSALTAESIKDLDINCLEVEGNKIIIGTLNHGILYSLDGGLSWKPSKKNIKTAIRAFLKLENSIYAGTDAGIFESKDMGITWNHLFGQMQILGFTTLHNKIYAATQNGALMSKGNATNWKSIYEGDALHDISNDGKYIYAMTIGQELLKTENDGALWENAQNGIIRPPNFYTNELQHIGDHIFSGQWIGIYHSTNHGKSWEKLKGLPDATAFSTLEITDFGIMAGISIR